MRIFQPFSLVPWYIPPAYIPLSLPATSGAPIYPNQAKAAVWASATSYVALSFQQIADANQPSGSQAFPDQAKAAARASVTSYVGMLSAQAQPDALQPPGSQAWPSSAPPARRAATYETTTWQPPAAQVLVVSALPVYPYRASGPLRAATYDTTTWQPPGGQILVTSAYPIFPLSAPSARRAASYDVSLWQPPIVVMPATGPFGHPVFPDVARGLGRATADIYSVVNLPNTSSIVTTFLDLGRFRLGSTVSVVFALAPQSSAPVATITGPSGTITAPLTTRDGINFTLTQFLGDNYMLGTYITTVLVETVQFEVVAGGDYGGGVISLIAVQNVNGWQVLAQLQNGTLVMGMNPRIP